MNIDDIAYRRFDALDRAKLVRLLASEYAPGHDVLNPAFLDWLYRDNPAGMAGFIVARDAAGEYRGIVGVVPFRLAWGSRKMTAFLALHVLVDKAARGANLFGRMIVVLKHYLEKQETFLFGHPNPAATPSWQRNGMRFLDGYTLGWNGRLFDTRLRNYARIVAREELAGLDFSPLASWRGSFTKPMLDVDAAFLAWRYLSHPTRRYVLALRQQDNRVLGYTAIAPKAKAGMDVIVDWQGVDELAHGAPGRFLRPAFVADARHPPAIAHPKLTKTIPFFATPFAVSPHAVATPWDSVSLAACDFL